MCNCIRRNRQFHLLGLTLPKNWFRFGNSENWCQNKNQHPRYTACANFQSKWTTLNFLAQFCPKMDLGLEIEKSNVGIRIKILKILSVPIFNQYGELWLFRHKFAQKCILGSEFQKPECEFRISTFKILCVPIFRKNWQLRLLQDTMCANFQSKRTTSSFSAEIWGNCLITCYILILITLRLLQRAGWRLKWAG